MAMRQSTRLLVTLGAVAALAGGAAAYAYYGVFVAEREEAERKDAEAKLVPIEKDAVTRLSVTAKGETTVLEKREGAWRITSPVAAEADAHATDSLLDRLVGAKRKGAVKDGADPARFGLAAPSLRVTANTTGEETTLEVGDTNEFDGSLFVRAGGGPIATVEGGLRPALEKTSFDLREKRPWRFDVARVHAVRVEGDRRWAAERDGAGWKLLAPIAEKADGASVDRILNALQGLRATAIPAEPGADGAPFGLSKPLAVAMLELEGGTSLRLAIGAVGDGEGRKLFARAGDGFVAEVPGQILDDVGPELFLLRDKTLVTFDREAVARIEFEGEGEESFAIERKKEGTPPEESFSLVAPRAAPAKRWKASGALATLSGLKAAAWVDENAKDLGKYGLDRPRRTFTVKDATGKELAKFLVGSFEGDRVHVKAADSQRVALVDKSRVDELPARIADVEEVALPPAEPSAE